MNEEKKQGYMAGLASLFIGIMLDIIAINSVINIGWDIFGQIFIAFGGIFTILGIGSLWKPEVIGAITAQLLENISKNVDEETDSHKQVQSGTDRSAQGYTESGDITIEQHFHGDDEKDILVAHQKRIEIYEPLYNEIKDINKKISKFVWIFNAKETLKVWGDFKPSDKLRVPKPLEEKIRDFEKLGRKYYNFQYDSGIVLARKIDIVLGQYKLLSSPFAPSRQNNVQRRVDSIKGRILEEYRNDFLAGNSFDEKRRSSLRDLRSELKHHEKYSEESIYNRILNEINREQKIIDLRNVQRNLLNFSKEFEKYLEGEIIRILSYESKSK